jgi:hypothetical protein
MKKRERLNAEGEAEDAEKREKEMDLTQRGGAKARPTWTKPR